MIPEHSNPVRTGKKVWATYSPGMLPLDAVHVVCEAVGEPVHELSVLCWCNPQIVERGDIWSHPRGKRRDPRTH